MPAAGLRSSWEAQRPQPFQNVLVEKTAAQALLSGAGPSSDVDLPTDSLRPDPPIPIDAALNLLKEQADLLMEVCGAATVRLRASPDSTAPDGAMHFIAVSAPLWLAHEMLQGLVLCGRRKLAAPAHALTRAVWESLLNSNLHLFRGPAASMDAMKLESARISAANQTGTWRKTPDEELGIRKKLDFLRASPGAHDVSFKLERSHHYLYREASQRIHGNFHGSLANATLAGTSVDGHWNRDHEIEPMVMWLMVALDGTIGAFGAKFAPESDAHRRSRALVDALVASVPIDAGSPSASVRSGPKEPK